MMVTSRQSLESSWIRGVCSYRPLPAWYGAVSYWLFFKDTLIVADTKAKLSGYYWLSTVCTNADRHNCTKAINNTKSNTNTNNNTNNTNEQQQQQVHQ
jgi:hypothetical protein